MMNSIEAMKDVRSPRKWRPELRRQKPNKRSGSSSVLIGNMLMTTIYRPILSLWHKDFLDWPSVTGVPLHKDHITDWITSQTSPGLAA